MGDHQRCEFRSASSWVYGACFCAILGQLLFNACFACTDCDHELPASFGFTLLDFKMVNTAVTSILPFDPNATHLPVAKSLTLRTTAHLVSMAKVVGDIAQVSIQGVFTQSTPHPFVMFSVFVGVCHAILSLGLVLREWQDWTPGQGLQLRHSPARIGRSHRRSDLSEREVSGSTPDLL